MAGYGQSLSSHSSPKAEAQPVTAPWEQRMGASFRSRLEVRGIWKSSPEEVTTKLRQHRLAGASLAKRRKGSRPREKMHLLPLRGNWRELGATFAHSKLRWDCRVPHRLYDLQQVIYFREPQTFLSVK